MKFRFISDPGHGWVEVPMSLVALLGIAGKISKYSYRRGEYAYLEEDCDAAEFVQAMKAANFGYEIDYVYEDATSPIRSYARFSGV